MRGLTAWYDRVPNSIDGFFTLQDATGKKLFDRLPARSGQRGWTNTSWERGKSPIPYSSEIKGQYHLWLRPVNNGVKLDDDGIGLFWPISSSPTSRDRIYSKDFRKERHAVGLHGENRWNGSAGCIVLLWDTTPRKEQVLSLYKTLEQAAKYQEWLPLTVL